MADESQVAMLKRSVEEWNAWRGMDTDGPGRQLDLSFATLNSLNLSGANLSGVNLSEADLRGTRLARANLTGVSVDHVLLHEADWTEAALVSTYLTRSLFSCLDMPTLRKSGRLPLEFYRGCGLPDVYIDYLPTLLNEPIQFYSCFISYSTSDQGFAERLHADLQNNGVRCWFAPHDITGGKKIHEQIDEAIRIYDRLLLSLSDASMGSRWVKTEIANALEKEQRSGRRMLFPVSLVPFERVREWKTFNADVGLDAAREIREYYIPDFTGWDTDHAADRAAFDRLLKGLKAGDPDRD